jgi:hypothetical protein
MKGKEHITLDRILIPDDPTDLSQTTWTSIVEAQALYEVLLTSGSTHFNQAANTPFATGPIADKLSPFADNDYCNAILHRTGDIEELADMTEVRDLIHGMKYPDPTHPTPTIDTTITTEAFTDMVQNHCERTSSSPSGRYFGHYRTLLRDPELLGNIAALAHFCFKWGNYLTTLGKSHPYTHPQGARNPQNQPHPTEYTNRSRLKSVSQRHLWAMIDGSCGNTWFTTQGTIWIPQR